MTRQYPEVKSGLTDQNLLEISQVHPNISFKLPNHASIIQAMWNDQFHLPLQEGDGDPEEVAPSLIGWRLEIPDAFFRHAQNRVQDLFFMARQARLNHLDKAGEFLDFDTDRTESWSSVSDGKMAFPFSMQLAMLDPAYVMDHQHIDDIELGDLSLQHVPQHVQISNCRAKLSANRHGLYASGQFSFAFGDMVYRFDTEFTLYQFGTED